MNTKEHLASFDDAGLVAVFKEARDDLEIAANTQRNSEWHDACFAAVILYGQEMARRGIDLRELH